MNNRKCEKCGEYIPFWVTIDGKKHCLKNRIFCLLCSPFGKHNTRNLSKPFVVVNGKEQPKSSVNQSRARRRIKQKCVEYLGGKCCLCGYDKCNSALEFHHNDPKGKESDPAKVIYQWNWEKIVEEISKCMLVCSNCHREIHYGLHKTEELERLEKPTLKLQCVFCKKEYETKNKEQIYCSQSCSQLSNRKVKRPTMEELKKMIWEIPTVKISKIFGVSDKAIEKWCRAYKIEKPPRGYWRKRRIV